MRSRFEPDRQLTARMAVTMFLLGLVYVAFLAALIVLLKSIVLVVVIAAGLLAAQYWYSDRIALYAMHGRLVTAEEEPRLHGVIDRLCATADMPKPRVAVSEMELPNAFATGRNADHAVVCVTTGLQRRLTAEEFGGVLAHELSHAAHRDLAVILADRPHLACRAHHGSGRHVPPHRHRPSMTPRTDGGFASSFR